MKSRQFFLIAAVVILLDQATKLLVHFSMQPGLIGEIKVLGDWFKMHYTLNPGIAFGIEFGNGLGKPALTFFRILAVGFIVYFLMYLVKNKAHKGFLICISLILGGALGNVLDSIFYGVYLENNALAIHEAQQPFFYPWFYGKVVDMIYVDIWDGYLPDSWPLFGGEYVAFWPIFNIADSSIFIGVFGIIIFNNKFFPKEKKEKSEPKKVQ